MIHMYTYIIIPHHNHLLIIIIINITFGIIDLLSDFITLWAVQISRIPADEDHPYG